MLSNTVQFFAFFAVVTACFYLLPRQGPARKYLLLLASYVFYGTWNWKFLPLLGVITLLVLAAAWKVRSLKVALSQAVG